jgi:cobalt-zinc-cadmium efflux system outer membrane protein
LSREDRESSVLSRNGLTLAFAGLISAVSLSAFAAETTLEAAVRRTLESNPALQAEGAAVDALRSQAQLDGLPPALTFGADLENVAGTGSLSGVHGAEATLRLGRVIELGGKRAARQAVGRADVERQQNVVRQRQLDLAAETTRRYIAVAAGQLELELASQQWALTRETESAVRQRVVRGVAPEADQALAQIAVVRAEIDREHAEHALASAQFALVALWGESSPRPIEVTGELLDLPDLPKFDALAARLADTPELAAFALDSQRLQADRELARASSRPDLSVSLGVRRLEALDDQGLVLSFAMPFGTATRSTLTVARNDAQQIELDARQQVAGLDARQQLFARYQELLHARTAFDALTDRMIPAAKQGLALTQRGYDNARYSVLQLTQTQATLLQLQLERLAAAARYHQLLADIERSTASAGVTP